MASRISALTSASVSPTDTQPGNREVGRVIPLTFLDHDGITHRVVLRATRFVLAGPDRDRQSLAPGSPIFLPQGATTPTRVTFQRTALTKQREITALWAAFPRITEGFSKTAENYVELNCAVISDSVWRSVVFHVLVGHQEVIKKAVGLPL